MFIIFLGLTALIGWVLQNPAQAEKFASISVLNEKMMASNYYPGNTTLVPKDTLLSWNIQVYNHLGSIQLMLVRAKLSNATLSEPNATYNLPGSGFPIANFTKVVLNNETWTIPLQWEIVNETTGSAASIHAMRVNDQTLYPNLPSVSGQNFRIEIELWTYDLEIHAFLFSFRTDHMVSSVWNQLWFNI